VIVEALWAVSGFFALVGAVGIVRFKEVYLRLHANTVCTVGGTMLLLASLALQTGSPKYLLLILFLAITSPTASHIIASAAYESGIKPTDAFRLHGGKDV